MDFSKRPNIGAAIPAKGPISCLEYHSDGIHLFSACESNSSLTLINSQTGMAKETFLAEREGVKLVSRTHHDQCVLLTSTKTAQPNQFPVHYWSLYDNKLIRKFRGHTGEVTDISLCPADDSFLTASKDKTVRLWDASAAGCIAKMDLPKDSEGCAHASFDSTGLVFGVSAKMPNGAGNYVHLYDARNYGGGAFAELKVTTQQLQEALTKAGHSSIIAKDLDWTSLNFNINGNSMLVETTSSSGGGAAAIVLDGFEGTIQTVLAPSSAPSSTIHAAFTPDDQSVLLATQQGTIEAFHATTGSALLQQPLTGHTGPVSALAVNPKYAQFASGCSNTCLWIW